MTAPIQVANRFDILIIPSPDTLEAILTHFHDTPFDRSTVRTTRHADGTLAVKVIVERLAEDKARAIHDALKRNERVKHARLEHFWP